MKRCNRCGHAPLELTREDVTRRRRRLYRTLWYTCGACGEIGLAYRIWFDELAPDPKLGVDERIPTP